MHRVLAKTRRNYEFPGTGVIGANKLPYMGA